MDIVNTVKRKMGIDKDINRKEEILRVAKKCLEIKNVDSEEATKMSLILPLIAALEYDIHNSDEVVAEYTADIGIKRGEKVDYAIIIDGKPKILIEAKQMGSDLYKSVSQLYRYFSVTNARVGILTDGVQYLFFTDSERINIMDLEPYLYINMKRITQLDVTKLLKYSKGKFSDNVIKQHIVYEKLYGIVTNMVNSILDGDIDPIILKCIENELGVKLDNTDIINDIIKAELDNIVSSNEKVSKVMKAKRISVGGKVVKQDIKGSTEYNIGDVNVHGSKIEYAIIFGQRHDNISYASLLVEVLNGIYGMGIEYIDSLIKDNDFHTDRYSKISTDVNRMRKPRQLVYPGVYVETHLGGADLVKLVIQIMDKCGIPLNKVKIKLKKGGVI